MRVTIVANFRFPERSQTFVLTQALYLSEQGHDVEVLCDVAGSSDLVSDQDRPAYDRIKITTWQRHYTRRLLVRLPPSISKRVGTLLDRRKLAQLKTDVVLAHFGWAGARVAAAAGDRADRLPLITIYHGYDVSIAWLKNRMAAYRQLFQRGALHLTVNGIFAGLLVEAGAPADRVKTHHLGVPIEKYAYSPPSPGNSLLLYSVCRLVEKKGIGIAIRALAKLAKEQPELSWRYEIGGEGPDAEILRALVNEHGLEDRIHFLGPLKHEAVLGKMREADVLLQPSVTGADGDQEGIPVVLMEAMAIGALVCTTRHSGIPELVEHGVTGLLSDEHNVDQLAANIAAIARQEIDSAALSAAAREKVEREFNAERQNQELVDHLRRVAQG